MQRSLSLLMVLGIATFGANASARTIEDKDKIEDNDRISTKIDEDIRTAPLRGDGRWVSG